MSFLDFPSIGVNVVDEGHANSQSDEKIITVRLGPWNLTIILFQWNLTDNSQSNSMGIIDFQMNLTTKLTRKNFQMKGVLCNLDMNHIVGLSMIFNSLTLTPFYEFVDNPI